MTVSRKTLVSTALDVLLVVALIGAGFFVGRHAGSTPSASVDQALVPIGRAYAGVVLGSYATAWNAAADQVQAGKPVADALASVKTSWEAERSKQYTATVATAFDAIVPEAAPDASVTPVQRAALAAAFRGFAKGIGP